MKGSSMKQKTVSLENIKEVLNTEILIASDSSGKKLVYNPWKEEYIYYLNGEAIVRSAEWDSPITEYNK
jgi:hypothetical protein